MAKLKQTITEFRHYELPISFPVLLLSGERWHISDVKSDRLHFHNCLEIGICHSQSGIMEFEGVPRAFKQHDISCVPRNLPHTTYSSPGEASLWTYIFLEPDTLFGNFMPSLPPGRRPDLSMLDIPGFQYLRNRSEYPKIYYLAAEAAKELAEKPEHYQESARALLFALCLEIRRSQPGISSSASTPPRKNLPLFLRFRIRPTPLPRLWIIYTAIICPILP